MSTKHLEALVDTAIVAAQKHEVGPEAAVIIDRARRELEAIRRAATDVVRWNNEGQPRLHADAARGWSVLESIAREAK